MAGLSLDLPVSRLIIQRDNTNHGKMPVVGQLPQEVTQCRIAATVRQGGRAKTSYTDVVAGMLDTSLDLEAGFYDLTVTALNATGQTVGTAIVERVGVGLVLATFGHSVPQGGEVGPAAGDDRACTVDFHLSGGPDVTLPFQFRHIDQDDLLGPFNKVSGWGLLADQLIQKLNMPVLIMGACFGGSNLEQCIKVINQVPFTHGFINYAQRMPIYPIEAILTKYAPITGLHGILMHHGTNDRLTSVNGEDSITPAATITERFKTVIAYLRGLAKRPDLPVYVTVDSTDPNGAGVSHTQIRAAELDVLATLANVRQGAQMSNINQNSPERPDGIHLSVPVGITAYAAEWNRVLSIDQLLGTSPAQTSVLTNLSRYGIVDGEHIGNVGSLFPLFVRVVSSETYVVGRQDDASNSNFGKVFYINRELLERLVYTGSDKALAALFTDKPGGTVDGSVTGTMLVKTGVSTTIVKRPDPTTPGTPVTQPVATKPDLYDNGVVDLSAQLSQKNALIANLTKQLDDSKPAWWVQVLDSRYLTVAGIAAVFVVIVMVMWPRPGK